MDSDVHGDILSLACPLAESPQLLSLVPVFCQASCTWAASAPPCTIISSPRSMEGASSCGWKTQTRPAWCLGRRRISRTCWSGQVSPAGTGARGAPGGLGWRRRSSRGDGNKRAAWGWQAPPRPKRCWDSRRKAPRLSEVPVLVSGSHVLLGAGSKHGSAVGWTRRLWVC